MSPNPFNVPLSIDIKPTLQKALLIIIPHLLALVLVVSMTVFSLIIKLILLTLILLSLGYYYQLHINQKTKKSVMTIQQDSVNNWLITLHNKDQQAPPKSVILLASSYTSKYLIVLSYHDINKSYYSAIITPDAVSSNDFRRLQVRLKLTNIKKR